MSEVVMADYATLLRDRVTLKCRSLDRIFLQAYVPQLRRWTHHDLDSERYGLISPTTKFRSSGSFGFVTSL